MKKDSEVDCHARTITEEELHAAVVRAVSEVCVGKDSFLLQLERNIEKGIAGLQGQLLRKVNAGTDCDDIGNEIRRLKEEKYRMQLEQVKDEELKIRIRDLRAFAEECCGEPIEYSEDLVQRLIERVTVYDNHFAVEFKSGIEIDV